MSSQKISLSRDSVSSLRTLRRVSSRARARTVLALSVGALGLGGAFGGGVARAANETWTVGTGTVTAGSGTWDLVTKNWLSGTTNAAWLNGSTAVFAGSDGAWNISLVTNVSTAGLTFSNSGYTIGSTGPETITNTGSILVASGKVATLGSGLLVSTTGGVNLVQSGSTAGGTLSIASGATLAVPSGAITIDGAGSVLNINGTLAISSNSTNYIGVSGSPTINVGTGGTFSVSGSTATANGLQIGRTSTAALNINGGTAAVYGVGDFRIAQNAPGSLSMTSGSVISQGDLYVGNGPNARGTLTMSGGTVTVGGAGTNAASRLIIVASNAGAVGTVNMSGGTLSVVSTSTQGVTFGTSSNVAAQGIFNLNGGTLTTPIVSQYGAALSGTFSFNGGTLQANNSTTNFMTGLSLAQVRNGGGTIDTQSNNITIAQNLVHSTTAGDSATDGGLTKVGSGTLTLSGTESYTGNTTISAGTLNLTGALGTGTLRVNAGAGLSGQGTVAGGLTMATGSLLTFNPTAPTPLTIGGNFNATAGGIDITLSSSISSGTNLVVFQAGSISGTLANFTLLSRGTLTFNNPTSPTELLLTYTAGNLVWKGANATNPTYWDGTTTSNWTLNGANNTFLPGDFVTFNDTAASSTVVVQSAVSPGGVTFSNNSKVYSVSGGPITTTSVAFNGSANATVSSVLNAASVAVNGTGTAYLTANNTIGSTVITSGQLQLGDGTNVGGSLGSGPVAVNGTLTFNYGANAKTLSNTFTGTGTVQQAGAGTTSLSGDISGFSGALAVNGGALDLNTALTYTTAAQLTGTGGFIKDGQGTVTLASPLPTTLTGMINVNAGTLVLANTSSGYAVNGNITVGSQVGSDVLLIGGNNQINPSSILYFNSGGNNNSAFLRLAGYTLTVGGLQTTQAASAVIEDSASQNGTLIIDVAASNTYTYDGIIRDRTAQVVIQKTGPGTQILANSAGVVGTTYTGQTTVTDGVLQLNNFNGWSSPIEVDSAVPNALTLNQTTNNLSLAAGMLTGAGAVTKIGTGTLTVTGAGAYTGLLSVNAGTLNTIGLLGPVTVNGGTLVNTALIQGDVHVNGGTAYLSQAATGSAYVTAGTLNLIGTVSGGATVTGGTLNVTGSVGGDTSVTQTGTIGGQGTIGGNMALGAGSTLAFNPSIAGNLIVSGNIDASAGGINLVLAGSAGSQSAVVVQANSITYSGNPSTNFIVHARGVLSLYPTEIDFTYQAANLVWKGQSANPTFWDVQTTTNFYNSGSSAADVFWSGDNVTFDDTALNFNPTLQTAITAGNLTFNNNANAYVVGGAALTAGTIAANGTATVTLDGSVTATGTVTIAPGANLQIGNADTSGSLTGSVVDNGTLTFNRTDGVIFNGGISGTGGVTAVQGGNAIGGVNSFTGPVLIEAGVLYPDSATAFGVGGAANSVTTINSGATIYATSGAYVFPAGVSLVVNGSPTAISFESGGAKVITWQGPVTVNSNAIFAADGGSSLLFTNTNAWTGSGVTVSVIGSGLVGVGGNVNLGTGGSVNVSGNFEFVPAAGQTIQMFSPITGTGTVSSGAPGTTVITLSNSYAGGTSLNDGVILLSNGNGLGSGAVFCIGNTYSLSATLALTNNITVGNTFNLNGRQGTSANAADILNVSGANTISGNINGNTGGQQYNFESDAGTLTISGNYANASGTGARYVNLNGPGTGIWSGQIGDGTASVSIQMNGTGTWTLTGSNTNSGSTLVNAGTLVVGDGNVSGSINTAPISVTATGTIAFNHADNLTISNAITGTGSFQHMGSGTVTLTGALSYSGNTTVSGNAGRLIVTTPLLPVTGSLVVTGTGASVALAAPAVAGSYTVTGQFSAISVAATGSVVVPATNRTAALQTVLVTQGISLTGGVIDLGNNDMVVQGGSVSAVSALVGAWYDGGKLDGLGLEASSAGGSGNNAFASLGVISNSDGQGGELYATFDGVAVAPTDVLVKYTYLGDTTLKGYVDATDLANTLAGLNGGLTGWENGDFNYDGVVNSKDLSLLLASLAGQSGSFGNPGGGGGAVPEPSSLALAVAALPMLGRRRRSN